MDITPDQIRAARAMLNLNQADLARRTGKSFGVVTGVEWRSRAGMADPAHLRNVRHAPEKAGTELIPRGIRRRPVLTAEQQVLFAKLEAISKASGEELKNQQRLTDGDLCDENGLPA